MSKKDSVRNWKINVLTAGGILPVIGVVAVTAWVSYGHIVAVSRAEGEQSAELIPVAIDGMMFAMGCLAAVDRLRGYRPRGWAIFGLWLGSMLTLAFNVLSAWTRGWLAMGIAAISAVSMIISIEAVFHPGRIALDAAKRRWRGLATAATPPLAPTPAVEAPQSAPAVPATVEAPLTPLPAIAALQGFDGPAPAGVPRATRRPRSDRGVARGPRRNVPLTNADSTTSTT